MKKHSRTAWKIDYISGQEFYGVNLNSLLYFRPTEPQVPQARKMSVRVTKRVKI